MLVVFSVSVKMDMVKLHVLFIKQYYDFYYILLPFFMTQMPMTVILSLHGWFYSGYITSFTEQASDS